MSATLVGEEDTRVCVQNQVGYGEGIGEGSSAASPVAVKDTLPSPGISADSSHAPVVPADNVNRAASRNSNFFDCPEFNVKATDLGSCRISRTVPDWKIRGPDFSVDSMYSTLEQVWNSWSSEANFSQDISHDMLMFLLWIYRYGLEEAIKKAKRLDLWFHRSVSEAIAAFVDAGRKGRLRLPEGESSHSM
jgi:hypothetical protein